MLTNLDLAEIVNIITPVLNKYNIYSEYNNKTKCYIINNSHMLAYILITREGHKFNVDIEIVQGNPYDFMFFREIMQIIFQKDDTFLGRKRSIQTIYGEVPERSPKKLIT